jgi:hypothetical protein
MYDIEWGIASNKDKATKESRSYVVGVSRAASDSFTLHRKG